MTMTWRGRASRAAGFGAALAALAITGGCASPEYAPGDYGAAVMSVDAVDDVAMNERGLSEPAPTPPPEPEAQAMFGAADRRVTGDDETLLLAQAGPPPGEPGGGIPDGGSGQQRGREEDAARPAAPPRPGNPVGVPRAGAAGGAGEAGDPVGPLLIYSADLHLAVFEVRATQREVVQLALDLGGFLASQDDGNVTIRVPSRRFHEGLAKVEAAGELLHRNVQAQDVSEQYRDLAVRLKNSEAVRDRLERLLAEAQNVEEALRVHAELARVTEQIEQFKGTLRFLADRVAFSTIAVHFSPKASPSVPTQPQAYRLPFAWLDRLGLPSLMTLH